MREKLLVVGSTGILGSNITRRLLATERDVRILVREGSDYAPLVAAGAEPVMADLRDAGTLVAAFQGVDRVLSTANSVMRGGEDNLRRSISTGTATWSTPLVTPASNSWSSSPRWGHRWRADLPSCARRR